MNVAPYSRQVAAQIADPATRRGLWGTSFNNQQVSITVATGTDAWDWAKSQRWRLVLVSPPGQVPLELDWRIVAGHPPILLRRCGAVPSTHFAGLVTALLRDGAERVLDLSTSTLYFPEVDHAA